ncbi:hypothetical protein ACFPT7_22455 [Acidicapsa dinghuensis]|uniref:Uncharacterized protein n=1 Tax=Acidicapsa dinghuensis TaxID=2218256 RepID=A0ABW1ELE5_9BACT|nr:hypothetical protein [Acidicapsa dinghuensis]
MATEAAGGKNGLNILVEIERTAHRLFFGSVTSGKEAGNQQQAP